MAEVLSGSVAEMSLLEIVKLLNSGKMSGRLVVKNSMGTGEIYIQDGQVVHCVFGASMGTSALTTMLGWIEGHFSFESKVESSETSINIKTEQLLLDAARTIKDWMSIKKIVTSMNLVFALSPSTSTGAVSLQSEEWQILAQVNGLRTVAEIVETTGKDEYEVAKILFHLHSSGLLTKLDNSGQPATTTVAEAFFVTLEKELKNAMGPMAEIVIDETIENLGEARNSFPQDKIPVLVEKVSMDIRDEGKRLKFSQIMLELLKNL